VSLFFQVLVTGLATGAVYGLVAIGYSLLYRLTGIVYFALGDLIGFGVFVTLLVAAGTGPVSQTSISGGRFALALALGVVVCVGAGIAGYVLAIQPHLARGSTIGWVAGTVAVAFALRSAVEALFTRPSYVFPDPIPFRRVGESGVVTLGGASIQVRAFYVVAVAVALAALATWTLERTRFGRGLQAIAADAEGARIVGVPVERWVALAFGLAGGVAAVAAVAAAPSAPFGVEAGALLGVKGLVAAVVVRFGSPWRAFAAGLVLGVIESAIANLEIGNAELGPQYSQVLPLAFALALIGIRSVSERSTPA
jgi:branched-chain amino acid transport system permease protein